jgi:hypothetical protein
MFEDSRQHILNDPGDVAKVLPKSMIKKIIMQRDRGQKRPKDQRGKRHFGKERRKNPKATIS